MTLPDEFDTAAAQVAGMKAPTIDEAAAQVVDQQRTAVRASLYTSLLQSPDVAARAQQLGKRTGLPSDLVLRNLPEVERNAQLDDFDRLLQGSPTLAQWVAEQGNAAIAHDDLENLSGIERAMRDTGGAAVSGLLGASAGVVGLAQAPVDFASPFLDPLAGTILPENPLRRVGAGLTDYRRAIQQTADAWMPRGDGNVESGYYSGVASLSRNVAALPLAFAPGGQGPALGAMVAPVFGQEFGKATDAGLGVVPALTFGASQAAIEYATEKLPLSRLIGDVKAGAPFVQTLLRQAALEIPGEQVATVLQDLNDWAVINPDKPFADYLKERPSAAAQTLVATIVGTGGQVTLVKGAERLANIATGKAQRAEQGAAVLEDLNKLGAASKVLKRNPESFNKWVEQASEGSELQTVFIDGKTLMQSGVAEQIAAVSPSVAAQLQTAAQTGGQVAIPVAEYASTIAPTEFAQSLLEHLRTEPDGFSRAEAQQYMQSSAQQLEQDVQRALAEQQGDETFKASQEAVKASIQQDLDALGKFTPEKNEADAALFASYYAVRAAQLGTTPEALYARRGVKFAAESVGGGRVLEQSGTLVAMPETKAPGPQGDAQQGASTGNAVAGFDSQAAFEKHGGAGDVDESTNITAKSNAFADMAEAEGYTVSGRGDKYFTITKSFGKDADGYDKTAIIKVRVSDHSNINRGYHFGDADINIAPDDGYDRDTFDGALRKIRSAYVNDDLDTVIPSDQSAPVSGGAYAQQARGTFNPENLTISLLKGADLSTALHEGAHFFFENDIALAAELVQQNTAFGTDTQTEGERQIVADVSALLKWHGLTGTVQEQLATWYGMDFEARRTAHERTAESFEAYLFEGKAPSLELAPYFQKFRAWLVNVYKSLKDFLARNPEAGKLDDTVRGVFDRMLASSEQIALAEQGRSLLPLFTTPEQAGMTVEEFAAYQAQGTQATADAIEDLQARGLRDMKWLHNAKSRKIKDLQKQAAARRAEVRMAVRREVMGQPVYRAWQFLANRLTQDDKAAVAPGVRKQAQGLDPSQDSLFVAIAKDYQGEQRAGENADLEQLGAGRFDLTALKSLGLPPEIVELVEGLKMTAKDGLHPDLVADLFEFPTGEELVRSLAIAEKPDVLIEVMTDARMLEQFGDLASPEAIDRAADKAIHNEARTRMVATEANALAKATGAPRVLSTAARDFAARMIARLRVKDIKPGQYASAQAHAAKAAAEAVKAGDLPTAAAEKRNQLIQAHAAKAAYDALAEAESIRTFFGKVTQGTTKRIVERGRDPDVVQAARAVLAAYGVGQRLEKGALEYLETVKTNDPGMYEVLRPSVEMAQANAKPLDQLTMEELRGLADEVRAMWHLAKRSRQLEMDGNLLDVEEVAGELQDRMVEIGIPETIPGEAGAITKAEAARHSLQFAGALLRRVEQWAEAKDGRFGGPFLRYVFQPVKAAADRYRADRAKFRTEFVKLLEQVAPSMKQGVIDAPELGYTFGRGHNGVGMAELLHAVLHTGNASNKRKLLLGRRWAVEMPDGTLDTSRWDAFIARMQREGTLAKEHYDFAQGVWDLLEKTKPLAQKTHRDVFGRYFDEVTAEEFTTPFGTYRGGYVPAQADPRIVNDAAIRALAEQENQNMAFAFPGTAKGFTKSRTEYNRPLMLDLRTLAQHLDKVLLFSHMEPAVRDVNKLLRRKGVSYNLSRIDPAAYEGMLIPWLNRAARQQVETPIVGDGRVSRVLSVVRQRAGMALMFGNISNTIQQVTGLSSAAVKVKPADLMRATAQYIASPRKTADAVAEASIYMRDRMENEVSAINDAMDEILLDPNLYEKAQAWSQKHAYFLQSALDNVLSPIVWTGAYNQAVAQGMEEVEAVKFADGVVRQTQGTTLPEDVSRIETGPAYARLFTQFVGYFNMLANTNATALKNVAADVGLRKGAGKALGIVFFGLLAPAWIAEAIAVAFRGGPDDEDDDGYLDDWLAAVIGMGTLKTTLAGVPFGGQFVNAGINRFNGNPVDDRVSLSPAVSLLESAVGAPQSVYKAVAEDGNPARAVKDVATAVSIATGLPAYAVSRPLSYLAGVQADRIDPTGPVDAARGLVTGTASPESRQP